MSYEDDIFYLEPDDGSRKGFRKAAAEIGARADAEIAELRRDAERYLWLRDGRLMSNSRGGIGIPMNYKTTDRDRSELDATIDAAIDAARGGE